MVEQSPMVSAKNAAVWRRALQRDLGDGEDLISFVSATRLKPLTVGTAITSHRVIGFTLSKSNDASKRLPLQVRAEEIRGYNIPDTPAPQMRIMTATGEVVFGDLDRSEVRFACRCLDRLLKQPTGSHESTRGREQRPQGSIASRAARLHRRPPSFDALPPPSNASESSPARTPRRSEGGDTRKPASRKRPPGTGSHPIAARASEISRRPTPFNSSPAVNAPKSHDHDTAVTLKKAHRSPGHNDPAQQMVSALERLAALYRQGLLDEDEFKAAKRAVIHPNA